MLQELVLIVNERQASWPPCHIEVEINGDHQLVVDPLGRRRDVDIHIEWALHVGAIEGGQPPIVVGDEYDVVCGGSEGPGGLGQQGALRHADPDPVDIGAQPDRVELPVWVRWPFSGLDPDRSQGNAQE